MLRRDESRPLALGHMDARLPEGAGAENSSATGHRSTTGHRWAGPRRSQNPRLPPQLGYLV